MEGDPFRQAVPMQPETHSFGLPQPVDPFRPPSSSSIVWNMRVLFCAAQMLGLISIAFLKPEWFDRNRYVQVIAVGWVLGVAFAQLSLAAATCALGRAHFLLRFPLALLGAFIVTGATFLNLALGSHMSATDLWIIGGSNLAIITLVQLPMWLLRWRWRLTIARRSDPPINGEPTAGYADLQFGIRELMVLTFVAALVCSLGRWIVYLFPRLPQDEGMNRELVVILVSLAISNSLVALIVITGALLPGRWKLGIVLGVVATAIVTGIELTILSSTIDPPTSEIWMIFLSINLQQYAWLMMSLMLLRAGGYQMRRA